MKARSDDKHHVRSLIYIEHVLHGHGKLGIRFLLEFGPCLARETLRIPLIEVNQLLSDRAAL